MLALLLPEEKETSPAQLPCSVSSRCHLPLRRTRFSIVIYRSSASKRP